MGKCDFCGNDEAMPYRCKYCGGFFCSAHRLPENHNCMGMKKSLSLPSKVIVYSEKDENLKKIITQEQKTKSKTFNIILTLSIIVVGLFLSWELSFSQGYSSGFSKGFDSGEARGEQLGFEVGYNNGFITGNETGFLDGYDMGFENGRYLGSDSGYKDGYSNGYNLGYIEGNYTGYNMSYQQGLIEIKNRAFNLGNPTYSQVKSFLRIDKTDKIEYRLSSFVCYDFARTVKANAFDEGIHCFYVSIDFPEPPGHALVAFNTTDRGLVFFEPQEDKEMDVEIGIRYFRDNGRYKVNYDDTIVNIDFIW